MSSVENKALLDRFVDEGINGRKLDVLDEIVAADFVELDPFPGQGQGREGLKQTLRGFVEAFPDLRWQVEEQVCEGEKVVSRFVWSGTHRGTWAGVPATGATVTVKGVVIDRVVDGQLVDSRLLMDTLGMLGQMGVIDQGPG